MRPYPKGTVGFHTVLSGVITPSTSLPLSLTISTFSRLPAVAVTVTGASGSTFWASGPGLMSSVTGTGGGGATLGDGCADSASWIHTTGGQFKALGIATTTASRTARWTASSTLRRRAWFILTFSVLSSGARGVVGPYPPNNRYKPVRV